MLSDLSALFYLESRQIVNRIRHTLHHPARAILYVAALVYFAAITSVRSHGHRVMPMSAIPEPYAGAVMFAFVTLLGVIAYGAASGILGAFASPADARFLTGSAISERTVVVWLQLRRSGISIARMLFTIVLYALIFAGSGTVAGITFAMLGGTLVATAEAVPMLKLRGIIGARTAQSLAGAIIVIGIAPMLILLSSLLTPSNIAAGIQRLGAGIALNALFNGNPTALGALYACGALLIVLSYGTGTGLYPDLYGASIRAQAFREKHKRGSAAVFAMEHAYEHRRSSFVSHFLSHALSGPWTIAWKELMAFTRSPSMQRAFWFGAVACAMCGALFGTIAARSEDPVAETVTFASIASQMIIVFAAMSSAIGLGEDLRKPLWWIGADPLWTRLFAWTIGTSWRFATCLCAGMIGWAFATRSPGVALGGIPLSIAAVLYLRAIGLAIYALFPSTIDQRGPLAVVRVLLTLLLATPPAVVGGIAGTLLHSVGAGVAFGIAASVVETLLLVGFAAGRISGRGIAFAHAESL